MLRPLDYALSSGFFSYLLSYKECLYFKEKQMYLKDLKILLVNRNLSEILIVDNTVAAYYLNMDNGIPIIDFEGNPEDRALFHLTVYLKNFLYEEDVREKISIDFGIKSASGAKNRGSLRGSMKPKDSQSNL
jgi:TFIIF-interacting CTD phosphatase-like protein